MTEKQLKLYEEYKDYPAKIVHKNFKSQLAYYGDDLLAEADYQLLYAIKNYNESRGTFSSYAYMIIYYGVYKYLEVNILDYKRYTTKENGKIVNKTIKFDFTSLDKQFDFTKGKNVTFADMFGEEEKNYDYIEYSAYVQKVLDDLTKLTTTCKKYKKCDLVFKTFIENSDKKLKDIIAITGMPYTSFYNKWKLLKEYLDTINFREELING